MSSWLVKPDAAALILRLMLAAIFIAQGCLKIIWFEGGTSWYQVPGTIAPAIQAAVAWGELVCGVALALGFMTRLAALGIIVIMVGAIYQVAWALDFTTLRTRNPRGFITHEVGYEYNYAIMAMSLSVVILGGGVLSLDHFLRRRRRATAAAPPVETEAPVPAKV
jgi:putative oxidoreductase